MTAFSTLDQLGGLLYTVILSRQIGPQGIGMYQVALSFAMLIVAICASGLPFVLGRRVAEFEALGQEHDQNCTVTSGLLLGMGISCILCLFFVVFQPFVASLAGSADIATMCLYLLPSALANSVYACFRGALWGKKKFIMHSMLEIAEITLRIALALFLFQGLFTTLDGVLRACLVYSISCVIVAVLSLCFYLVSGGGFALAKGHTRPIVKSALPISGMRVASSFFQTALALLFNLSMTRAGFDLPSTLAEFGMMTAMVLPLIAFPVIFTYGLSIALLPEISAFRKTSKTITVRRLMQKSIDLTLVFAGVGIALYLSFAPSIASLIFDPPEVGQYVRMSCWIMIPLSISSLTTNLQNSLGFEYKSLLNYFLGSAVTLVGVWLLPRYMGGVSLIVSAGVGTGIITLLNLLVISRELHMNGNFLVSTLKVAVCALLASAFATCLQSFIMTMLSEFFSTAVAMLCCILFYLALCAAFDIGSVKDILTNLKAKFASKRLNRPMNKG